MPKLLVRFSTHQKCFTTRDGGLLLPEEGVVRWFKTPEGYLAEGQYHAEDQERYRKENARRYRGRELTFICDPALARDMLEEHLKGHVPSEEACLENWPALLAGLLKLFASDYDDASGLEKLLERIWNREDFLEFLSWSEDLDFSGMRVAEILEKEKELRQEQTRCISYSRLKGEFGFTDKLIAELLPEPLLVKNPHYASAAPMKLFRIRQVEKAMETEAYKEAFEKRSVRLKKRVQAEAERRKKEAEKEKAAALERKLLQKEWREVLETSRPQDYYPKARAMERHFIIHAGPTNSGKTHEALRRFEAAENGAYLAPLRLLACEIAERTNSHGIACSMLTGEEQQLVEGASHISSTVEMADLNERYEVAVIDECQLIGDSFRGGAWTQAIMGLCADEIHLCTAPYALKTLSELIEQCGDSWEVINHERLVPLQDCGKVAFHQIQPGDALIVFSRRSVYEYAARLKAQGFKVSILYGALPYDVKQHEAETFASGVSEVLVATDCVGMGMNLPIRRVLFAETEKYDGVWMRPLKAEEVQQIAGRAGRFGQYEVGYCGSLSDGFRLGTLLKEPGHTGRPVLSWPGLLGRLNGPFSEKIRFWQSLKFPGFATCSCSEVIAKAELLETKTKLKQSEIQAYASIPFRWRNEWLQEYWFDCAGRGAKRPDAFPYHAFDEMERIEMEHEAWDIYYHFCRLQGNEEEQRRSLQEKRNLSRRAMEELERRFLHPPRKKNAKKKKI